MDTIEKVKWIEEEIMEEIQGAKNYMNCSKAWEEKDYEIAKTFHKMATQEMMHADELNKIVTKILSNHLSDADMKRLPELMKMINSDQITNAKNYVPDADPEPVVRTATPTATKTA
jgi:rubrerythrin